MPPRAAHLLPAKHLQTEQLMTRHTLKTRFSRYQMFIDRAFAMVQTDSRGSMVEVCQHTRAANLHV